MRPPANPRASLRPSWRRSGDNLGAQARAGRASLRDGNRPPPLSESAASDGSRSNTIRPSKRAALPKPRPWRPSSGRSTALKTAPAPAKSKAAEGARGKEEEPQGNGTKRQTTDRRPFSLAARLMVWCIQVRYLGARNRTGPAYLPRPPARWSVSQLWQPSWHTSDQRCRLVRLSRGAL